MAEAESLADMIAATAGALSLQARAVLVKHLRAGSSPSDIRAAVPAVGYQAAIDRLLNAWTEEPDVDAAAVALALESAARSLSAAPRLSLVWTGPTTNAVTVRRTDQALLQLINAAKSRLLVVSFAVYKVPMVAAALRRAGRRGVGIDVVVETQEASGGKMSFDGWTDLAAGAEGVCRLWTWANDRRPIASSGQVASLHAKCAVADSARLLVSSANLTEFAQQLNMELGVLIRGGELPERVQRHFDVLMSKEELVRI